MKNVRSILSGIACVVMLLLVNGAQAQISIEEAAGYNLVTFGDFIGPNGDVEGGVAVGGNAVLRSFSINPTGTVLADSAALVVQGDLTYSGGDVFHGDVYVGGNVISAPTVPQGNLYQNQSILPYDFVGAQNALINKSAAYAAHSSTVGSNYVNEYGTLKLQANDPVLNIFNLSPSDLTGLYDIQISGVGVDSLVLVNVSGEEGVFESLSLGGGMSVFGERSATGEQILFNLNGIDELHMSGIGFLGSILAPDTDVFFTSGQMEGQLIANSFQSDTEWSIGELHARFFSGNAKSVPEPKTYGIIGGLFLLGLSLFRRFKK